MIGLCLLVSTALAADKFPNHNLMTRFIGADTNEAYSAVVNDGTVYKLGTGSVTLSPATSTGSSPTAESPPSTPTSRSRVSWATSVRM